MFCVSLESSQGDNQVSRGETCAARPADGNNNTGNDNSTATVDINQQYRDWKEMMLAATAARDQAEQEKQVKKLNQNKCHRF